MIFQASPLNSVPFPRDPAIFEAWSNLLRELFRMEGSEMPVLLSDGAKRPWEDMGNRVRKMQALDMIGRKVRSHLGKWEGMMARYALLFHVIDCRMRDIYPTAEPVTLATMQRVERLFFDFFRSHALAFYADIFENAELMERARWVAGYLLSESAKQGTVPDSISRRTVKKAYRALKTASDADVAQVMAVLETYGWLRPQDAAKGLPSRWAVNPNLLRHFAVKAAEEPERRERERAALAEIFGTK
jgi:hypothetical protein